MGVSPDQFRAALGRWPSGVSVVTSQSVEPVGMTVSAFFSISLVPPLIGVSLDRQAATLGVIEKSRRFAVNVLSAEQAELSDRFALAKNESVRFQGVALYRAPGAYSPLLAGAVVHLDCELEATHPAGDHVLCVGRIHLALSHPGDPLLFHAAGYHRLTPLGPDAR
jgi:flavin reductase (DIM6/NTAB) family NADH-FMN oxidoreductase RutF